MKRLLTNLLPALIVVALLPAAPAAAAANCMGLKATITGTPGNDILKGTGARDVIAGGGGNDILIGNGGNDVICGGNGDDRLVGGAGDDRVEGGNGDDRIQGGPGDDRIHGDTGNDVLIGGRGNDILTGSGGRDDLDGGRGNDRLIAGQGEDDLSGGGGSDFLDGGWSNDIIKGGVGPDRLRGGAGADTLVEVMRTDTVLDVGTADAGRDRYVYQSVQVIPLKGKTTTFWNSTSWYNQHHLYPLTVRAASDGLVMVERIPPETYLRGIAEVPFGWPAAALRAQAIAARTYLANLLSGGRWGVMATYDFDICATPGCQLYVGSGNVDVAEDGQRWADAVDASADRILMHRGAPILALYHSTSGPRTRSVQDVWPNSGPVTYLKAVPVPDQDSPFESWSYGLSLGQFLNILAAADLTFTGRVTGISTIETSDGGGPYRIRFHTTRGNVDVTADRIQAAMNTHGPRLYPALLPAYRPDGPRYPQTVLSPTFTVRTLGDGSVRVRGNGWGHQLGLSQYGARAMAAAGSGAISILRHFYSGVWPQTGTGLLPDEIDVGLAWERSTITLQPTAYRLRTNSGIIGSGRNATLTFTPEGDWVTLSVE